MKQPAEYLDWSDHLLDTYIETGEGGKEGEVSFEVLDGVMKLLVLNIHRPTKSNKTLSVILTPSVQQELRCLLEKTG